MSTIKLLQMKMQTAQIMEVDTAIRRLIDTPAAENADTKGLLQLARTFLEADSVEPPDEPDLDWATAHQAHSEALARLQAGTHALSSWAMLASLTEGPDTDLEIRYAGLSAELRSLREQAGLTRDELAEKVGATAGVINHAEHGRRAIPFDLVARWALACGQVLHVSFQANSGATEALTVLSTLLTPKEADALVALATRMKDGGRGTEAMPDVIRALVSMNEKQLKALQSAAFLITYDPVWSIGKARPATTLANLDDLRTRLEAQHKKEKDDLPF